MPLMLLVVACYTICSLSDKYAVAKLKFDGNTLTFLMAAATSLLMLFYLPFDSRVFVMSWQAFASILLMAVYCAVSGWIVHDSPLGRKEDRL